MRAENERPEDLSNPAGHTSKSINHLNNSTEKSVQSTENNLLSSALAYAERGWAVLPLHTPTGRSDKPCSCNKSKCQSIGKHPRTMNGVKDSSTDAEKIRNWWSMWPDSNIGLATGSGSGIIVIDIDPRNGGNESLADLQSYNGMIPETRCQVTGGDGRHLLFRYQPGLKNSNGRLGRGVDFKSDGGYIVAAPSLHFKGQRYRWADENPIIDIPDWMVNLLSSHHRVKPDQKTGTIITEGHRNSTLTSLAGAMRRQGAGPDEIESALSLANSSRCQPPLDDSEIIAIAGSISRYDPNQSIREDNTRAYSTESESDVAINQWPAPPSAAAFHGLAGEIVRTIDPHTESDPVAILVQTLTAFGNAIGRSAHFSAEADKHYGNLFTILVGNTSKGRKGTSWGQVRRLFEFEEAKNRKLGEFPDDDWVSKCISSGLSSGEGLIWAVRDPIEKMVPVKEGKKFQGEYQQIVEDFGVPDKRLLVYEPEFASVIKTISRDGNTLSAMIRQAWDKGDLKTLTKNSPARSTAAHISIIGHITKDELRRYLEATETANGFANRFLWVCVRQSKLLPEGGNLNMLSLNNIRAKLRRAIEFAKSQGKLRRDEQARAKWIEIYPDLVEGAPGMFGAVTSRAESQVMRLSTLYALLDGSNVIKLEHLEAGLALWRYSEDSARFIFGEAMGDPVADAILAALNEAGDQGLTRTEIHNVFSRRQSATGIETALKALAEAGRARSVKEKTEGRPIQRWFSLSLASKKANIAKKAPPTESRNPVNSLNSLNSHIGENDDMEVF